MRAGLSTHHASPQCQDSLQLNDPFTDPPLLRSNHRITSRRTARPYLVSEAMVGWRWWRKRELKCL
ncbi:hypothetical protein E2C01_070285 [Portunus trituberculatus]|uniref:Uncharacterized protein n=1 Tax=Portunus trituberculatus TaxID=210409 RepID=A0A5B7I4Q2_PORTR|nr:hypothetical protein [Portunus trituberculatus]